MKRNSLFLKTGVPLHPSRARIEQFKRVGRFIGGHRSVFFPLSFFFVFIITLFGSVFWLSLLPNKHGFTFKFRENLIYQENQKEGTTSWESRSSPIGDIWADTRIRGYADSTSINHGEAIGLYVSTAQARYDLAVYRIGWYGGTGARLLLTVHGLPGQNQPVPAPQAGSGLIAANWKLSYTLQTATDWVSGAYLVKLVASDGSTGYIFFVLRDDTSTADILYQIPVTTYQAYNNWGGKSLYDYNSAGGRAYKVSFDRPYAAYNGAGYFFLGDYNMIRWLESQGYNLSYATSIETQTNPGLLKNHKIFLTDYHDEYWSKEMRDNITAALKAGKNLAFFGANNIYWQIRFESSVLGQPDRVIVCYKDANLDPIHATAPTLTTVHWRDPIVNQPENALLGVMYESLFKFGTSYPWVVTNANHWMYSGTGLQNGDAIPGLIGYEYDKVWNNGLTPKGLVVLSNSPVVDEYNNASYTNSSLYTAPSGGMVFTAGTMYWSWKLDDNDYLSQVADPRVQQMTANILNRMTGYLAKTLGGIRGGSSVSEKDMLDGEEQFQIKKRSLQWCPSSFPVLTVEARRG